MLLKSGLMGFVALALMASAANAQSASSVLARYGQDPQLSAVVASEVAADPQEARDFCSAASNQGEVAQVYVGAGLAEAYRVLLDGDDATGAGMVLQTACSCSGAGSVAASFANSVGGQVGDVCSSSWSGDYAGTAASLFSINASGGGSSVSRN